MNALKLVIVDDFVMMIEFLRTLCRQELGFEVVGEATTGGNAVDVIGRTRPDLVLLDLDLPGFNGFQVIEAIRRSQPVPQVTILSGYCNDYIVHRVEHARVAGYICKPEINAATFQRAMTTIAGGGTFFSDTFCAVKAESRRNPAAPFKLLSRREIEILALVGDCWTDAAMARQLEISERTIEKHRLAITAKLDLGGRVELQRFAREHGFGSWFR